MFRALVQREGGGCRGCGFPRLPPALPNTSTLSNGQMPTAASLRPHPSSKCVISPFRKKRFPTPKITKKNASNPTSAGWHREKALTITSQSLACTPTLWGCPLCPVHVVVHLLLGTKSLPPATIVWRYGCRYAIRGCLFPANLTHASA